MDQPTSLNHPIIILVRGLPGSGKSYITKPLAEAVEQMIGQPVTALDPDAIDYKSTTYTQHVEQLTSGGVDPALHAYRFLRAQAYATIESHGVAIWNQPFTNLEIFNKMVGRFNEHAASVDTQVKILVIEVDSDVALARQRVLDRKAAGGHGPSEATFDRFVHDYVSFAPHGYDTVNVDGQADVDTSVATIMHKLSPLLTAAQSK